MKSKGQNRVGFNEPLHLLDTEKQTFGCRANNPDICGSAYMEGICAFVCADGICHKPTNAWKKQYERLKGEKS